MFFCVFYYYALKAAWLLGFTLVNGLLSLVIVYYPKRDNCLIHLA